MEHLVELVPKRGARVAPLAGREIREPMELRGIVERYAAQRLASQGRAPVAELRSLLERRRELTGAEQARETPEARAMYAGLRHPGDVGAQLVLMSCLRVTPYALPASTPTKREDSGN
ncbi:hypothetical protein [Streptomyces sparsogenes]|uniref:hypothetical protein n=1 Tax=Streptomyces sparsogenes TaxID=67365 RepID=UPI003F4CECBF